MSLYATHAPSRRRHRVQTLNCVLSPSLLNQPAADARIQATLTASGHFQTGAGRSADGRQPESCRTVHHRVPGVVCRQPPHEAWNKLQLCSTDLHAAACPWPPQVQSAQEGGLCRCAYIKAECLLRHLSQLSGIDSSMGPDHRPCALPTLQVTELWGKRQTSSCRA